MPFKGSFKGKSKDKCPKSLSNYTYGGWSTAYGRQYFHGESNDIKYVGLAQDNAKGRVLGNSSFVPKTSQINGFFWK